MECELYRSDNLLVRQSQGADCDRWVITFDNYGLGPGFDREGFGEAFLREHGFSAIHVLGRGDDWYQYDDIFTAAAVVRAATSGAKRRLTYGSSMGGFAALHLADAIGADRVLALSPQWAVDPSRAPWEIRWQQDAHRIRWLRDFAHPIGDTMRPVVVYDPRLPLDRRHAEQIAAETPAQLVAVPYCGHPVATFLGEVGMLRPMLEAVLDDRFDLRALRSEVRARRSASAVYLGTLAERQPDTRLRTAIALGRRAAAVTPTNRLGLLSLAQVLTRAGEHTEALTLHDQIVAEAQRHPLYLVAFANALQKAGAREDAMAVAQEVVDVQPDVAHLRNWHAALLWSARARAAAVREQTEAVALDPQNRRYRNKLLRYRALHVGVRLVRLMLFRLAPEPLRRREGAGPVRPSVAGANTQ